jgi:hypothetical protein
MDKIKVEGVKEALNKLTIEEINQCIEELNNKILLMEAYTDGLKQEIQIYQDLLKEKRGEE